VNWRRTNRPIHATSLSPTAPAEVSDDVILPVELLDHGAPTAATPDNGPESRNHEAQGDDGAPPANGAQAGFSPPLPAQEASSDEAVAASGALEDLEDLGKPEAPDIAEGAEVAASESHAASSTITRSAVILTVLNQKGGVGKTTTTVSLGAALAQDGLAVLVVDLDPQGNATTGLGLRVQDGSPSTYRVIVEGLDAEQATEATSVRGLHVLPSSLDLAGAEIELVPQFSREGRLRKALDAIRDLYDIILVDCPPSLGLLTINGLVAADQVLVPIQCEYYALEGLGQLLRTVELVRTSLNAELELGGVLMTMYDGRTNLSQQVVDEVREHFGEQAFRTIIPRTVRLSEAPSYGQPITVFDPSSRGARAYQRLASELAQRLGLQTTSTGESALDRLLGTAPPSAADTNDPPPPPPATDTDNGPRPLPTDLPPPVPPPPATSDEADTDEQDNDQDTGRAGPVTTEGAE
jgi:chromosome partitioning protein